MRESLSLGPVPAMETCQQVGTPSYDQKAAYAECVRYKRLMALAHPPPSGGRYRITSNPHDFGSYYEVEAQFDYDDKEAADWAFSVDEHSPGTWEELEEMAAAATVAKP